MENDINSKIKSVSADGGASLNQTLMQVEADIFNCDVYSISTSEATSLGVFYLVGLNKGLFKDLDEIKKNYKQKKSYRPRNIKYEIDYNKWNLAIKAVEVFSNEGKSK